MCNNINKIFCGDVLKTLSELPEKHVDLMFTSPPYNVNINYDNSSDNMSYEDYLIWLENILKECNRVLKVGGRIAINIDAITNREADKEQEYVRCIYAHLYNIMQRIGMKFRTEICWIKQNAVGKKTAWGSYQSCSNPCIRRNHEYVLVWSKDQWKHEGDSELSDMTKEEFHKYTLSTWDIVPETRKLAGHPAAFPEELAKRIIKLFSYRGDVVMDIFNGTGTTTSVAARLARKWIGIDNSQEYVDFATERTRQAQETRKQEEMIKPYIPKSKRIQKGKEDKNTDKKTMINFGD